MEPMLSEEVGAAIRLHDQRFINPGAYVHALADEVIARGGKLATGPGLPRSSTSSTAPTASAS